jgi:hypothetical protein
MSSERVRPVERRTGKGEQAHRLPAALIMALVLVVCTATAVARSGGMQRPAARLGMREEVNAIINTQGNDGMAVDLSTLPRTAQMHDLAHAEGRALGKGRGQYDALLQNGPLDPPRSSTLEKVATQSLAVVGAGSPSAPQGQQHSAGIGIGGSVHLLRSAREILAGKMAAELEGRRSVPEAKRMRGQPRVSPVEAQDARAVWQPPVRKPSLEDRAAALAAKVKKLERAAGAAEISELAGLSQRR